ncbi:hypothetical protein L228DRAFT_267394 [Xylona heveae TC161]|uniref:Uncharacterized protein n=1 Tax=Xylona heveae (strain CBS 132557 / TC161) TaxID=1328760 RepID=A0A161TC99_XYLHT|nr:hypothetical protein L228DRAFT_267394 [Xylona heveae TC161]KZF23387.1 hypothetical protein L228DRAFT_267394 [Xylona heveae TC161]
MDDGRLPRSKKTDASRTGGWGSAFRKKEKKRDPFDPLGLLSSEESFRKDQPLTNVASTWATYDLDNRHRTWSQPHNHATGDSTGGTALHASRKMDARNSGEQRDAEADFLAIPALLQGRRGPRSAFERRNPSIARVDESGPVKVVIGAESKTVFQRPDTRAEQMDEEGKYVDGVNRGKMRKGLEEERGALIRRRREAMSAAKAAKRAWDALSPEGKEREGLKKQRSEQNFALYSAGLTIDVRLYTALPERVPEKD